jgi:hypothetical protein
VRTALQIGDAHALVNGTRLAGLCATLLDRPEPAEEAA